MNSSKGTWHCSTYFLQYSQSITHSIRIFWNEEGCVDKKNLRRLRFVCSFPEGLLPRDPSVGAIHTQGLLGQMGGLWEEGLPSQGTFLRGASLLQQSRFTAGVTDPQQSKTQANWWGLGEKEEKQVQLHTALDSSYHQEGASKSSGKMELNSKFILVGEK